MPVSNTVQLDAEPFDASLRGISLLRLDSRFSATFDYDNPSGVRIVGNGVASRIADAIGSGIDKQKTPLNRLLAASVPSDDTQTSGSGVRQKSLDFWIHLVHGCNFSCHYCYIPHLKQGISSSEIDKHSLNRDTVVPIITRLFEHCNREGIQKLGLKFAGGEPTLNLPLLEQFCETAIRLAGPIKVTFGIITNGSFPAEAIHIFSRYRFNVSISIDGSENAHDQIRYLRDQDGEKIGSFKGIMENARRLKAERINPYFLFTVTPRNVHTVDDFGALARDLTCGFRLSLVRLPISFKSETIENVANHLVRFYTRLGEEQPISQPIERFARFAEWNLEKKKTLACSSGSSYYAIDTQGGVSTCQMALNKTYGSLATESLDVIRDRLNSDPTQRNLTSSKDREGPCTRCKYYHVCTGGCPQHTKATFSTFSAKSPWCKVYGRLLPVYVEAIGKQMLRAYDDRVSRSKTLLGIGS